MSDRVFIDTSAFFAVANTSDAYHSAALATARRLAADQDETYTTNYVVAETHTLLVTRVNRDTALATIKRIYGGQTRIIRATEADEQRARHIVEQYADKDFSLIDTISFAVMERLHLRRAWTYDQHFTQFGFTQVPQLLLTAGPTLSSSLNAAVHLMVARLVRAGTRGRAAFAPWAILRDGAVTRGRSQNAPTMHA